MARYADSFKRLITAASFCQNEIWYDCQVSSEVSQNEYYVFWYGCDRLLFSAFAECDRVKFGKWPLSWRRREGRFGGHKRRHCFGGPTTTRPYCKPSTPSGTGKPSTHRTCRLSKQARKRDGRHTIPMRFRRFRSLRVQASSTHTLSLYTTRYAWNLRMRQIWKFKFKPLSKQRFATTTILLFLVHWVVVLGDVPPNMLPKFSKKYCQSTTERY